ncbi:MAG TPA: two-component regulator propeller domain-containing protein [Hanamia sp.]|nr:two-component regulator propeller domain-containing protein [Hanamia sp.]
MENKYVQNTRRINLKSLLLGLILLCATLPGKSQQVSITPVPLPSVPLTGIAGMCQDNNGFIWLATFSNGLYKYDGTLVKSYLSNGNNPNSICSDVLESICADKDGNIWIGSFENGLDRFDPETETFTHYRHSKSDSSTIRSDSIRAIIQSHDGILWIGTANGLDSFDPASGKFTHINDPSEAGLALNRNQIRALYEDKAGTIWIGCGSPFPIDYGNYTNSVPGGLYKLDRATGKITQYLHKEGDETSLIDNRVRAIFEDSHGTFWVGTAGDGLHIMDREKGTFQRLRYDPENPQKLSRPPVDNKFSYAVDHITFINEDAEGFIWIGTFSGGINRYNPVTKTVEYFGTSATGANKLETNDFWSCLKTKDNLLWISTWAPATKGQELYKISILSERLNYSHVGNTIEDFAQDTIGNMWFATNHGLMLQNKSKDYENFLLDKNDNGQNNVISNLEPDAKNNLWVSSGSGLYYFDTNSRAFKEYKHSPENRNSISSNTVYSTQLNGYGTIWVGTLGGLDLLDTKTGIFKHFKNDQTTSNATYDNIIYAVKKDKSGNIWVGSVNGVYRIDPITGKFTEIIRKHRLSITCIYEDTRGRIWLGSENYGLLIKNPNDNDFIQFTDSTGLISNSLGVYGITEDKEHSLWINSSLGILRLNPDTKNAVLFGKSWGINPNIMSYKGFTSSQGEIFFGDTAGYYHFYPKDFTQQEENITNLHLSKFYLDKNEVIPGSNEVLSQPLSKTKKITLNYFQNNFTLEYDNIDYLTDPSEKNVLYKLENYDKAWRKNNGENQANYYNVQPGKYVFRIKASNLYGNWTEKALEIVINPPWYKTTLAYIIYALLFIAALFGFDRFMRRRIVLKERQKAQERELAQAKEIEKAYTELKTTQSQLIQSEKMASLGELMAGIAHEIQNPLNFVNNFSEVSNELIDEMNEELNKGDIEEAKAISSDIKQNLEKINHHGKRAGDIVKGMLQHSRTSTGVKEPTDINALADEYLRLSYHGLRAKDKEFNAEMITDFDNSIGKINIIPQDIGRVLLNLYNNAFYACAERSRNTVNEQKSENPISYEPTVSVTTKKTGNHVIITVSDNGGGIPQNIANKIFQPFFTTKPTGSGTGLGLSLSYDIVKAHGGEIKVETLSAEAAAQAGKEAEKTTLIIQLPV